MTSKLRVGTVAIERDGETVDYEAGHGGLLWIKVASPATWHIAIAPSKLGQ